MLSLITMRQRSLNKNQNLIYKSIYVVAIWLAWTRIQSGVPVLALSTVVSAVPHLNAIVAQGVMEMHHQLASYDAQQSCSISMAVVRLQTIQTFGLVSAKRTVSRCPDD